MNISGLHSTINAELEQNKDAFKTNRSLSHDIGQKNRKIPVTYCFTHLKGEKYFIVTAIDHSVIIKMEKIVPVLKEEKEDAKNIKFPVIEFHYSPHEGDRFGVSIPDLLADKQKSQQLLLNLQTIKARYAAFGDTFLVDTNKVNLSDVVTTTHKTKFIPLKDTAIGDM